MGNIHSAAVGSSCTRADTVKACLRCAESGDVAELGLILDADVRYVLHSSVFGGNSAWHKAAKGGRADALEALRAAVLAQYELDSKDVSEAAVVRPALLRLGSSGADAIARLINKPNIKGLTPLMLACTGGHTECAAWLIGHGADVWRHDRVRRHTALHCAAEVGATDTIRLLLARAGSEVHPGNGKTLLEQGNHAGLTPLHYAVHCEQHEVVAQLVAQDADITAQAEFPDLDWGCVNAGDTPMHIAAHKGNIDAIQIMLKAYNEKSGALLPSSDGSRRLRDPRAMRNDYGRLPYHLAVRKGITWLGEMLDPSVPVRFLLTDEQLDSNTAWGPARLATIAAAVLHRALVADLKAIQALQRPQQQQQAAAAEEASAAPVPAASTAPAAAVPSGGSSGSTRRRWALPGGHQRSSSDVGSWVNRLSETSPRPFSSSSRVRPRSAGGSRSSGRGSPSAVGSLSPPPRLNLHEALGQLSPRALVAALVPGAAGEARPPHVTTAAAAGAADAGAGATTAGSSSRSGAAGVRERSLATLSPIGAGASLRRLARLASSRQQQQADGGEELALERSASDSFCMVATEQQQQDTKLNEADLAAEGVAAAGSQQQQQQAAAEEEEASRGKITPLPMLQPERPSGVLEALLKQLTAELKRPGSTSPEPASEQLTPGQEQQQQAFSSSSGSDGLHTCGVCLDAAPDASIEPCKHSMCAECALDMCERCPLATAVCPFCRCVIGHFLPLAGAASP